MTLKTLAGGFNRYLGDGVYASFDGYHIWLAANHHENKVVALEPQVLAALVQYQRDLSAAVAKGDR
jgi:hypothetical protein